MNKPKTTTIKNIVLVALSVIISVCLLGILVFSTFIHEARSYLTSEEFSSKIDSTDLSTLTFIKDGEKITLEQYVKNYVTENIQDHIKNNSLSDYLNGNLSFLFPLADSITDYTVDKALSSEYVNNIVKTEVHEIMDYILYSDADEAEERIKQGVTIHTNPKLDPENSANFEERISAEVKLAVFDYIETESGKSIDEIIVILSEKILYSTKIKVISRILFILLGVLNFKTSVNVIAYFSAIAFVYSGVFAVFQNSFTKHFAGNEDLISYEFLKPLMDLYLPYGTKALIIAIVLLVLFVGLKFGLPLIKKKKE